MRRIMHRRQPRPVTRPAFHVLLMGCFQKLQLSELPLIVELLHEEKLPGVNHRLHHHVFQAGLLTKLHDLSAILHRSRHGHGASNMLPGLQGRNRMRRMIRNRGINMNRIDLRISQESVVIIIALFDAILISDFIQGRLRPLANSRHIGVRMTLINGDKLGTKSQPDNRDINILVRHEAQTLAIPPIIF